VARPRLKVEVAIGDPELAERVREMLAAGPGFDVVAMGDGGTPDVLIADSVGELADEVADAAPVLVLGDLATATDAAVLAPKALLFCAWKIPAAMMVPP